VDAAKRKLAEDMRANQHICHSKLHEETARASVRAFYVNDPTGTPEELVDGAGAVLAMVAAAQYWKKRANIP
jgi:hypothetical protein